MKIDEIALFVFWNHIFGAQGIFFKWTKEGENMGKKQPLYQSFRYAFEGIFTGIRKERNMKIHCLGVICVTAAGFFFDISATEWCICLILFGLILGLELANTAVEAVVDLVTEEKKPLAKLAKDTAAGAVLIAAIMAAFAGVIIFLPKAAQLFVG